LRSQEVLIVCTGRTNHFNTSPFLNLTKCRLLRKYSTASYRNNEPSFLSISQKNISRMAANNSIYTPLFAAFLIIHQVAAQECFSNESLNDIFATGNPTCCQNDVCAIPCPEDVPEPSKGMFSTMILSDFWIQLLPVFTNNIFIFRFRNRHHCFNYYFLFDRFRYAISGSR
jgi:hypothetical protein